jgi:hypothetical protein
MHFALPSAPNGHFVAAGENFFPGCPWRATPYCTTPYSYHPPEGPSIPEFWIMVLDALAARD